MMPGASPKGRRSALPKLAQAGDWLEGEVAHSKGPLEFAPAKLFRGGMSGSPIIDETGAAIGVVSTSGLSPVIVDSLSAKLLREIIAAQREPVEA